MEHQRERPKRMGLSVQIYGKDADGIPFLEPARVREIEGRGAHLEGIVARLRTGDVIGVKCFENKALFRVISVYSAAIDLNERMVGIVNLQPTANFWGAPTYRNDPWLCKVEQL